jgi:hypothetical protein
MESILCSESISNMDSKALENYERSIKSKYCNCVKKNINSCVECDETEVTLFNILQNIRLEKDHRNINNKVKSTKNKRNKK